MIKMFAFLSRTQCSEVLCSSGHVFTEKFEDDSALLEAFLAFFANGYIEESLHIVRVELGQAFFLLNFLILVFVYLVLKELHVGFLLFSFDIL